MTSYHRWAGSPAGTISLHGYTKASAKDLADWKTVKYLSPRCPSPARYMKTDWVLG